MVLTIISCEVRAADNTASRLFYHFSFSLSCSRLITEPVHRPFSLRRLCFSLHVALIGQTQDRLAATMAGFITATTTTGSDTRLLAVRSRLFWMGLWRQRLVEVWVGYGFFCRYVWVVVWVRILYLIWIYLREICGFWRIKMAVGLWWLEMGLFDKVDFVAWMWVSPWGCILGLISALGRCLYFSSGWDLVSFVLWGRKW